MRYWPIVSFQHRPLRGAMKPALDESELSQFHAPIFDGAMAQAGEADYLVTGDKAGVLAVRRHGKTKIVTARKMVTILKL
jgi:hypothetical protein